MINGVTDSQNATNSSTSEESTPEKSKSRWQSRQETLPRTSEEAESSKLEMTAKTNRKNAARLLDDSPLNKPQFKNKRVYEILMALDTLLSE